MTITTQPVVCLFLPYKSILSAKIICKTNVGVSFRVTASHVHMEVPMDPGKPQMCNFAIILKMEKIRQKQENKFQAKLSLSS